MWPWSSNTKVDSNLLVITSPLTVLPGQDEPIPATLEVSVSSGLITKILPHLSSKQDYPQVSLENFLVAPICLPGQVDAHVHLNEPGRTEWEGFATGTAVSALVDLPSGAKVTMAC